ncbi:MAG: ribonuclease D [Candidatus Flexifilum sp.]
MSMPTPLRPPAVPAPAHLVDTDARLAELVTHLAGEPLLGVDTESNSLHAYRERVCLIQISTRSADYIIDPLTIGDLSPLGPLFADPAVEKVFHAAEYDLMCLKRDFGFTFANLFDTMIAARICGYKNIGLGSVVADVLGLSIDKSHQRDDWGARPLPPEGLLYAQLDTHFLPALRDHFLAELNAAERMEEAREAFGDLLKIRPVIQEFDPEGYWRIAIPNNLTRRQAAVLRELYLVREQFAERRDVPPFKIVTDKVLAALATHAPSTSAQVGQVPGIAPSIARRYGDEFAAAVRRGLNAPLPDPPPLAPPDDPIVVERYSALREWRKLRAMQRGVESDVILGREALWQIAERAPTTLEALAAIPGMGPWRLATYGDEILSVLKRFRRR